MPDDAPLDVTRVIELAMAGQTYRQMSASLGVDTTTLQRTLDSPAGQRLLAAAREELVGAQARFTQTLAMAAIRYLGRVLADTDASTRDRLAAASRILDLQDRSIKLIQAPHLHLHLGEEYGRDALLQRAEAIRQSRMLLEARAEVVDAEPDEPVVEVVSFREAV
jgi:hypothetical protein